MVLYYIYIRNIEHNNFYRIEILNFHSNENTEFTLITKELERISWLTLSLAMAPQTERLRQKKLQQLIRSSFAKSFSLFLFQYQSTKVFASHSPFLILTNETMLLFHGGSEPQNDPPSLTIDRSLMIRMPCLLLILSAFAA